MGVESAASKHWKKAMKMSLLLFRSGFNSSKCKTMAKMAVARIKLLRNKRDAVIKQMRRDIALLLDSGQDATARIRVEHVIREQNIMAANELIELFCELVVSRLSIIAKQRECPADLKEGISSLLFAGPRCSEIPELSSIRDVFQKKYGKDFVSAATDLRPNAGVNRLLIEKLSVKSPPGEIKLKVLKEIAKEYQVKWDIAETEQELLKPPEERIEGPVNFVSAASMPLKPASRRQSSEPNNSAVGGEGGKENIMSAQDLAAAAGVAAEKALAAAEAAVLLANKDQQQIPGSQSQRSMNDTNLRNYKFTPSSLANSQAPNQQSESGRTRKTNGYEYTGSETTRKTNGNETTRKTNGNEYTGSETARKTNGYEYTGSETTRKTNGYEYIDSKVQDDEQNHKVYRRQSYNCPRSAHVRFDESDTDEEIEMEPPPTNNAHMDSTNTNRRHSYNGPPAVSDTIKFDESDYEDEEFNEPPTTGTNRPPDRPAPCVPAQQRVHPKLPDYETLAARFEALKHQKPRA